MKALQIACRKCEQERGEWCRLVDAKTGELGPLVVGLTHAERIEDAAACTENKQPMSVDAFRAALDNSGRF